MGIGARTADVRAQRLNGGLAQNVRSVPLHAGRLLSMPFEASTFSNAVPDAVPDRRPVRSAGNCDRRTGHSKAIDSRAPPPRQDAAACGWCAACRLTCIGRAPQERVGAHLTLLPVPRDRLWSGPAHSRVKLYPFLNYPL